MTANATRNDETLDDRVGLQTHSWRIYPPTKVEDDVRVDDIPLEELHLSSSTNNPHHLIDISRIDPQKLSRLYHAKGIRRISLRNFSNEQATVVVDGV